jgi:AAHS family benzoate transporter-like MFS transporter
MTEYSPRVIRSLLTTAMLSGYAIGGILATVLGKQFVAEFGWQILFLAAGAPVVLIPLILKSMPESLSFVVSRKDDTLRYFCVLCRMYPEIRSTANLLNRYPTDCLPLTRSGLCS